MGHRLACLLAIAVLMAPAVAIAGDKERCGSSYIDAQRLRRLGSLIQARAELEVCLQECSEAVQPDCAQWLDEVTRALPSVVVTVQRAGTDVANAVVIVDGAPAANAARAVELDPGQHRIEVDVEGARAARDVVLREGEKNRRVVIELERPSASTGLAPPAIERPVPPTVERAAPRMPWLTIGAGTLGAAGLLTFASVGIYGNSRYADLEACRPRCDPKDVSSVRSTYAVADVALGVGIVALGVALVSYMAREER